MHFKHFFYIKLEKYLQSLHVTLSDQCTSDVLTSDTSYLANYEI